VKEAGNPVETRQVIYSLIESLFRCERHLKKIFRLLCKEPSENSSVMRNFRILQMQIAEKEKKNKVL